MKDAGSIGPGKLAGMEVSEWAAIEDGSVPAGSTRLCPIADALEIRCEQLASLVLLCRDGWEL